MGQKIEKGLLESVKAVDLTGARPNNVRLIGHPFTYEVRAGIIENGADGQFVLLDLAIRPDPGQHISAETLKNVSVKRLAAAVCVLGYVKEGDGPMYPYALPDKRRPETARLMPWDYMAGPIALAGPIAQPRRGRPPVDKAIIQRAKTVYANVIARGGTSREARLAVAEQVQPNGIRVSEKTIRRWIGDSGE